jgi:hypothetical protein
VPNFRLLRTQIWDGVHGTLKQSFKLHEGDVLALVVNRVCFGRPVYRKLVCGTGLQCELHPVVLADVMEQPGHRLNLLSCLPCGFF